METLAAKPAKTRGRRADVRRQAILITIAGVMSVGALVSLAPRQWASPVWQTSKAQGPRSLMFQRHVSERRQDEVQRRFAQGVAMLERHEYEHALTAFHRVIELRPRMAEAHANLGFTMIGLGRYGAAYDFFVGATELNPRLMNAYYGMAVALEALGDLELAVGAMRSYVHLVPESDPFHQRALAALWEWENRLNVQRGIIPPPPQPPSPPAPVPEAK